VLSLRGNQQQRRQQQTRQHWRGAANAHFLPPSFPPCMHAPPEALANRNPDRHPSTAIAAWLPGSHARTGMLSINSLTSRESAQISRSTRASISLMSYIIVDARAQPHKIRPALKIKSRPTDSVHAACMEALISACRHRWTDGAAAHDGAMDADSESDCCQCPHSDKTQQKSGTQDKHH
jgi:hypothetical protein